MSSRSPASKSFIPQIVIFAIVALAAALRIVVIGRDALWLDEGYSWWDARQGFAALWSVVPDCDPHPPLYFALLHEWIAALGDGTMAMRSLSVVLGLATVVLVGLAGRELDRARGHASDRFGIGALAALLFALTPFEVHFSIEARPYALLCFGAALLTLGLLKVIAAIDRAQRSGSRSLVPRNGWWLVAVGATVVLWTNNTSLLLLAAVSLLMLALWSFDRASRFTIVPMIAAGVVAALAWSPDLPVLLSQMREVSDAFWIPRPSLDGLTYELHYLVGLDSGAATWWLVLAMLGGLVLIARRIGVRWAAALGSLVLLPCLLNIAISVAMNPVFIARAMIVITPAFAVALAAAIVLVRPRGLRLLLAVCLIAVHVIAVATYLSADHVKEPWKAIVAGLAGETGPVLVVPNELALPLRHEADTRRLSLRIDGVPADYPARGMDARYPSGKCAPSVIGQDLAPLIERLRSESSVVLLTRRHNTYDPDEAVAAALRRAGFALASDTVYEPGDLRLMRFARPRP